MNRTSSSVRTHSQLPNHLQRLVDNAEKECATQLSRDKKPVIDVTPGKNPAINLVRLILEFKDDSSAEWWSHPKLLQLYFHQFDFELPTTSDSESVPIQPTIAVHGFRRAFPVGEFDEEYKQMCVANWPKMFKWLEFLYRGIITRFTPHPSIVSLDEAIESILFVVTDGDIDPRIICTKGLLGLSFAIHLHLAGKNDSTRLHLSSCILNSLTHYGQPSNFNEIRKEIGYDSRKAARAFFSPAYSCIQGNWIQCFTSAHTVYRSICEKSPDFYQSFSSRIVISYICDGLAFLLSHQNPYTSDPDDLGSLLKFLSLYVTSGTHWHGWILHGLRKNLLSLLLESEKFLPARHFAIDDISYVLQTIRRHSIYRPILHLLEEVCPGVKSGYIKHQAIRLSWDALVGAVEWSRKVHDEFVNDFGGIQVPCSYSKCKITESDERLYRCGGCDWTLYCSKECQKRDWIAGHRGSCRRNPYRRDLDFPQKPYTQLFLHFLLLREMRENTQLIKRRMEAITRGSRLTKPRILLVNLTEGLPPLSGLIFNVPRSEFPDISPHREPLLLPSVRFGYGNEVRVITAEVDTSGQLFGWID